MVRRMFLQVLWISVLFSAEAQPEDSKGCTVDGKYFEVGEHSQIPNSCSGNICTEDGSFSQVACGLIGLPYKWTYVPEDSSKPYPECCGYGVPPLDIVPDVLDKLFHSDFLDVTYEGGDKADMGNELTPTQVKNQPKISYTEIANGSFYLLAMTDPDAPSRKEPTAREFLHWLVGNIPGGDIAAGETITEYIGSGPPKDSGLHRYILFLYKQPGRLDFSDLPHVNSTTAAHRMNFHVQDMAKKYDLGDPVALNVYQAQYDDYVPQLHKQIGL